MYIPVTKFTARDPLHNRFYLGYAKYRPRSTEADQRERADLLARQDRNKRLYPLGDMTDSEYMKERGEIERALARLQPIVQSQLEIDEAAKLLNTFGQTIAPASPEDRKAFFCTVLEEIVGQARPNARLHPVFVTFPSFDRLWAAGALPKQGLHVFRGE